VPKHETLHRKIAELIWGMDQDSVETPLDKPTGPRLDDVLDQRLQSGLGGKYEPDR
jgi:hypothetical protein